MKLEIKIKERKTKAKVLFTFTICPTLLEIWNCRKYFEGKDRIGNFYVEYSNPDRLISISTVNTFSLRSMLNLFILGIPHVIKALFNPWLGTINMRDIEFTDLINLQINWRSRSYIELDIKKYKSSQHRTCFYKESECLQPTQVFASLCLCNLMVKTFNISKLNYLIINYS